MAVESIAQYLDGLDSRARPLVEALLECLREAAPDAEEGIKWSTPAFTQRRVLFSVAAHKHYASFCPTPSAMRAFAGELGGFENTASTVKLPYDKPLPADLIRRIAAWRLRDVIENDTRWM